jgi:hypothetical protein
MAVVGTVAQIPVDFGHGRSREAGQMKEDDEGIPFHTLLTAGTHLGDRILRRKMRRRLCSWQFQSCLWRQHCRGRGGLLGGAAHGGRHGAGRPAGAWAGGAGGWRCRGMAMFWWCTQEKGGAGQEGGAQAALLVLAVGDARGAALPGGTQAGGRAAAAGGHRAGGWHTGRAQARHSDGGSICSWM